MADNMTVNLTMAELYRLIDAATWEVREASHPTVDLQELLERIKLYVGGQYAVGAKTAVCEISL